MLKVEDRCGFPIGMDIIYESITVSQDDVLKGCLVASEYLRLANEIDKNIADIIKNCKSSAYADRAFHNELLTDFLRIKD